MERIEIKIPTQLVLLSRSLKKSIPNKLEIITIPILTRENTVELSILDVSNAFKKNTKQKKFGNPNRNPHKRLCI